MKIYRCLEVFADSGKYVRFKAMPKTQGNRIMNEFNGSPIDQLKQLMERLRHPIEGCTWDREQTI